MNSRNNNDANEIRLHKYWHYGLTIAVILAILSLIALLNGYYHFYSLRSYHEEKISIPLGDMLAGYLGIFLSILILPIPDYVLLPFYGYLSSIGLFNFFLVLVSCLAGAVAPIEFLLGYYAGSRLLRKILDHLKIPVDRLDIATDWVISHGNFSVFLSTFVPFFYSAASFSAGTLRMKFSSFMIVSTLGFFLRYVGLELIGYYSILVFTPEYDYRYRYVFTAVLISSLSFVIAYRFRINQIQKVTVPT